MPTPCSDRGRRGVRALAALLALCSGAQALSAVPAPSTAQSFIAQLLLLANLRDPGALQQQYDAAFGSDFAGHTHVLLSTMIPVTAANEVVRFVRLGDETQPLVFGAQCVRLEALEQQLTADGWEGGHASDAKAQPRMYRKGRTQLTVRAEPRRAGCAQSILITYRTPK
jgi:hypothetical protein